MRLWEIATGRQLKVFERKLGRIWSVTFSLDGKIVASSGYESISGSEIYAILLWDAATGSLVKEIGCSSCINYIVFSPGGQVIASDSENGTVGLWDVKTGQELRRLAENSKLVTSVVFLPDGNLLASGSSTPEGEGMIHLWNVGIRS